MEHEQGTDKKEVIAVKTADLLNNIKRVLNSFLRFLLCGCYPGNQSPVESASSGHIVSDSKIQAVENFLLYLENVGTDDLVLQEEHIQALRVLARYDNTEHQRTSALCFYKISQKMKCPLDYVLTCYLVELLTSRDAQVLKAATLAVSSFVRNGPVDNQCLIAQFGVIPVLRQALHSIDPEAKAAIMGCIRNLSVHKTNEDRFQLCPDLKECMIALSVFSIPGPSEVAIIESKMLCDINACLSDHVNPEVQKHAAGTIRNLAMGDHLRVIVENQCVDKLASVVLFSEAKMDVLAEVTAALAVLADDDEVKYQLVQIQDGQLFDKLVTLASLSSHSVVQYNSAGILGQISSIVIPTCIKLANLQGILLYIKKFLKSSDPNFVHIAMWTLVQHLKDEMFLEYFKESGVEDIIPIVFESHGLSLLGELAQRAMRHLGAPGGRVV